MTNLEFRLAGTGGQGLMLSARILAQSLSRAGLAIAQSQHYEPTSRGGLSQSDIVATSDDSVDYPLATRLDFLIILDEIAVKPSQQLCEADCQVLVDADRVTSAPHNSIHLTALPFTSTARKLGSPRAANIVALGALSALGCGCTLLDLENTLAELLPARSLAANLDALRAGHTLNQP